MKKTEKVFIIGHKNPDTDSICSAIAYADIKNRTTQGVRYIAKRAGQINEETEYVLKRFGVHAPGYMPNVGTQVEDMDIHEIPPFEKTMAEMTADEKNGVSHRGDAVRRFAALFDAARKEKTC